VDYILVENGQVKGYPRRLPQSWANIGNFHLLDDTTLRSYGWYPVRFVPAIKNENTVVTGQQFVIESTEVVQYEQVRQKTQQELMDELQQKWEYARVKRNELLSESDWTQIADSPLSNEKTIEWAQYRQSLREIPQVYTDPDSISWPDKP
jgi:hypothetical protein